MSDEDSQNHHSAPYWFARPRVLVAKRLHAIRYSRLEIGQRRRSATLSFLCINRQGRGRRMRQGSGATHVEP